MILAIAPTAIAPAAVRPVATTFDRLLAASELAGADGRVVLHRTDIDTALREMSLDRAQPELGGVAHPSTLVPARLFEPDSVDVTDLVTGSLREVLDRHAVFEFMAAETVGNDEWFRSVYFGGSARDATSLSFAQLCRKLVASVYVVEQLLSMERDDHWQLAAWYERRLADAEARGGGGGAAAAASSVRERFVGAWLGLKGESVLASINAFEELRRRGGAADARELAALGDVLNAFMAANIFEAVVANLSFAFWPDNARAGLALLLDLVRRPAAYAADGSQPTLSREWYGLYLAWNANFIWPSHFSSDMLCFAMLVAPRIALGPPSAFAYLRAHSLFWVVRSNQIARLERGGAAAADGELPCFRCRQLEPLDDRQPLTSRTAVRTRAAGEALLDAAGDDDLAARGVGRLLLDAAPRQLASIARLYARAPKASPTKLRLLS